MQAIRVRRRIESDILRLPELRQFLGKDVEIIVLVLKSRNGEMPARSERYALRGSVLRYDDPLEPVAG